MKGLERTAKAWMDAVQAECPILPPISVATVALQRALLEIAVSQQELADLKQELSDFKQTVSDAIVSEYLYAEHAPERLQAFTLPAPKPDPLREIAEAWGLHNTVAKSWVEDLRATLDARGLEIREKNDDRH